MTTHRIHSFWSRGLLYLFLVALVACILPFTTADREDTVPVAEADALQQAADSAWQTRQYALNALKARGVEESAVTAASYGFTASEYPICFAAFSYGGEEGVQYYGYRIRVNEQGDCTILEEGETLGETLMRGTETREDAA